LIGYTFFLESDECPARVVLINLLAQCDGSNGAIPLEQLSQASRALILLAKSAYMQSPRLGLDEPIAHWKGEFCYRRLVYAKMECQILSHSATYVHIFCGELKPLIEIDPSVATF
jgi:hypothetical protein